MTGMEEHAAEHATTRRAVATLTASLYGSAVSPAEQEKAERAIAALSRARLVAPAPLQEEWACRCTLKSGKVMTRQEKTEREAREWLGTGRSTIVRRYATEWELHESVDRPEGDGSADCGCADCHTGLFPIMHVCADCGSKRCPRAIHHANPCNGRADQ